MREGKPVPLEVLADYRVENFDRSLQGKIVKIPSLNTWVIKWDNGKTSEEYPLDVDLLEPGEETARQAEEKLPWQMTWEEFQQTIEVTGTTEDNGSQAWVRSKSGKEFVHQTTTRKLLSPDLWAKDLAHEFHENAVAEALDAGKPVPPAVVQQYSYLRLPWEMTKEEFKKSIRPTAAAAAPGPGDSIEFFGADLEHAQATLAQTQKGRVYITRSDGSQLINPRESSRDFATKEEAWDEYYKQSLSRAVAEGETVPLTVIQEHPDWPLYKVPQWPEIKGVFVGGCVARGVGSSFRASAHAHCFTKLPHEQYPGWICVRSLKRVGTVVGKTYHCSLWFALA